MGSNVSRTVKICVSKLFQMAEAPKDVVVTSENVTTPQEEARSTVPEVETIPGESSGAAPVKIGSSPAPSLSPMTPEEKTEERMEGEIVVKEPARKKTRLQYEVSGLADRVDKACETMNGLSSAMSKMCDAFQAECADPQQGLKAMGLQGISNKGMLAAMVTYENTLRDISWQVSGNGKAQTNVSLKAATIALGDKVTSVHQVLKEINKSAIDHNKGLMEQLSSLELAIKSLNLPSGPAVFPPGGFDAMPAFVPPVPPATPAADSGSMASRPEMQSDVNLTSPVCSLLLLEDQQFQWAPMQCLQPSRVQRIRRLQDKGVQQTTHDVRIECWSKQDRDRQRSVLFRRVLFGRWKLHPLGGIKLTDLEM